eukprot:2950214-Prymnesium_polylepis.1
MPASALSNAPRSTPSDCCPRSTFLPGLLLLLSLTTLTATSSPRGLASHTTPKAPWPSLRPTVSSSQRTRYQGLWVNVHTPFT